MPQILIGTSGWIYKDWAKRFYPTEIKSSENKFKYFSRHFPTVEINNSFYRLPSREAFAQWQNQAPKDFIYSVKLSRYLTHMKRLKVDDSTCEGVDRFCGRACRLSTNLGCVLVQLPANFRQDLHKMDNLARQFEIAEKKYGLAFPLALEVRHSSWFNDETYSFLKQRNIALVTNSSPDWPEVRQVTADFAYIRFHGSKKLYASSYTDQELDSWAVYIKSIGRRCRKIFIYFNNDQSAKAVENAKYLLAKFEN